MRGESQHFRSLLSVTLALQSASLSASYLFFKKNYLFLSM